MKITPIDCDYEEACRGFLIHWRGIKESARIAAARRILVRNRARTMELIARLKERAAADIATVPLDWFQEDEALRRELDHLFAAHDELLEVAFPLARAGEVTP